MVVFARDDDDRVRRCDHPAPSPGARAGVATGVRLLGLIVQQQAQRPQVGDLDDGTAGFHDCPRRLQPPRQHGVRAAHRSDARDDHKDLEGRIL